LKKLKKMLPSRKIQNGKIQHSFSERFEKIGRGFIKIHETWQFGLSFNIIRHVFFCIGQKIFLSVL
jgi:hypothetical protein